MQKMKANVFHGPNDIRHRRSAAAAAPAPAKRSSESR